MLPKTGINKTQILQSLERMGALALKQGRTLEIAIYGGAAMTLQYDARVVTQDVDAVVHPEDKELMVQLAATVGDEEGFEPGWLNDAVKGFVSHDQQFEESSIEVPGLRILFPTAEYLLAMKCMAMRVGEEQSEDRADIEFLLDRLGFTQEEDVLDLVAQFYPPTSIPPKTVFGIREILSSCSPQPPRPRF